MRGSDMRMLAMLGGSVMLVLAMLGVLAMLASSPAVAMLHRAAPATPLVSYVRAVDEALARDDLSAAVRAWHDAYGIALASRRWEAMIDVGDAFLRVSAYDRSRDGGKPNARQAYLIALMRARSAGSATGVRRAGDAFAALGDLEVAAQCFRIATRMSAGS
jgi:hypothetical protein